MDGNLSQSGSSLDLADAFEALAELSHSSSPLDAAWVAAAALDALITADRIALYLYDPDLRVMRRVAGKPDAFEVRLDLASSVVGRALAEDTGAAIPIASPDGDGSLLVRGVSAGARLLAGIVLSRSPSAPVFGLAELRVTDYVADRLAERLAGR